MFIVCSFFLLQAVVLSWAKSFDRLYWCSFHHSACRPEGSGGRFITEKTRPGRL